MQVGLCWKLPLVLTGPTQQTTAIHSLSGGGNFEREPTAPAPGPPVPGRRNQMEQEIFTEDPISRFVGGDAVTTKSYGPFEVTLALHMEGWTFYVAFRGGGAEVFTGQIQGLVGQGDSAFQEACRALDGFLTDKLLRRLA